MRSVLFLGGGGDSVGILRRAANMGLEVHVADSNPDAPGRQLADKFYLVSAYDADEVNAVTPQVDAVLCAGVDAPHVMATVAADCGIVGPSAETAELSRDKVLQIKALNGRVRLPWTENADLVALDPPGGYLAWPGAFIIKPADSRGARGVVRLTTGQMATPWVEEARLQSPTGRVLVQRWVDGEQLSSESLVQDGKILWTAYAHRNYARLEQTAPAVIEDGSDMPPAIPAFFDNDWERVGEQTLQECVTTIGLEYGTLKGDLVWDGRYMTVIEVACRLSGGRFCSDLIPACWGVDFVGMAIRIAIGEHIYPGEISPYLRRHVCQRFEFPSGKKIVSHPQRGRMVIGLGGNHEEAEAHAWAQLYA